MSSYKHNSLENFNYGRDTDETFVLNVVNILKVACLIKVPSLEMRFVLQEDMKKSEGAHKINNI